MSVKRENTKIAGSTTTAMITAPGVPENVPSEKIVSTQSPQNLVDAIRLAFGSHHARAVHAKGILVEGTFTPTPDARTLSVSPIFGGETVSVTARFSNFTGIPDISDISGNANPRGFAVKLSTIDGDVDIVCHSFNGFPVATTDEFAILLRAIGASGADAEHPTPLERFLESYPIAKTFLTTQKPPPLSYATLAYYGVNSFAFTNAEGASVYVRYRFVPQAGDLYLTPAELETKTSDYLHEELAQRVCAAPVKFDWYVQIAEDGDKIDDPSVAWPEERTLIKLGTITIRKLTKDPAADKRTLFLPGEAHPGILPADRMLTLRNKAYPISFKDRQ